MRLCVTFLQTELRNVEFGHTLTNDSSYLKTHWVDGSKMVSFQFCLQKTFETFNYHAMRLCVTFLQTELRNVEFGHISTDDSSYLPTHRVDGSKMVSFQFCLQKTYETFNYHAMRLCVTFLQTELRNVEFRHTLTDHTSYLRSHF